MSTGNTRDALALLEDPIGGKPVCLNHALEATMVCQIVYYKFSDGTYAISYGVEKESSLVNAHYSRETGGPRTYGSFIGSNAAISLSLNSSTTDIEDETINAELTVDGVAVSDVGTNTNGGTDGGETIACVPACAAGETCVNDTTCMCGVSPACAEGFVCTDGQCIGGGPDTILVAGKDWMTTDL